MKVILGSFLTLGICLFSLTIPVVAQATTLGMGNRRGELLTQTPNARKAEADQLFEQGKQQFSNSQFQAAIKSWQQALKIYREIGVRRREADSLNNLGYAHHSLGQYQRAIEFYQQSLDIYRKIGYREGEAKALNNLGNPYHSLGQYQQAIEFHQQSLDVSRKIGYREGEADSLNNLGNAYQSQGQYQRAIEFYQQSLDIYRKIDDPQGKAYSLNNLGNAYDSLGQSERAIESHQQSLEIYQKIVNPQGEANSLNNLGNAYHFLGQYQQAIEFYQQSLQIYQKIVNPQGEAKTLNNLGNAYYSLGQYERAIESHQQSLEIYQKIGDSQGEANSLNNLGNVYNFLGQYERAIEFYQQSLDIDRKIGSREGEASSLNNLGNPYYSLGQYERAIKFHQQSLDIYRKIGSREGEANSLNNLGNAFFKSGKFAQAETTLYDAIKVLESLRTELTDLNKVSIFETQANTYTTLQQVLIALNKANAALEIAERGRARAFVELLATQLSSQPDVTPPNLDKIQQIAKKQNATLVEYAIIYDDFKIQGREQYKESELYSWVIQPTGKVAFRKVDIKPLWQQQETSEPKTSVREFWQKYLASWGYPVTLAILIVVGSGCIFITIRRKRLVPWSLLAVGSTVGLLGLVGYNQLSQNIATRSGEKPKTALAKLVFSTHETSQKGIRGLAEIASGKTRQSQEERLQELHQLLIEPIAELLPTEPNARIIFIPQGNLFFVPFPALQDESGKHLIEKHTILTAPSIQVLELTRQQRQILGSRESGVGSREFMVVGNPTMPKVASIPGEPPKPLEPLPGAEQEAKEIASLLNTQAIIGNQATEAAIVQQMPKARFIHLATHGLLDDLYNADIPGAIALAPSGEDDGLLRASEILKLKLNAELVVLSACDTGQGRITGDGVIGLSRSLFTAGVPSVVASLWKVPDEPTAFLMANFYKNLQKQPDKAQALRQAMLTTMEKYPNPRNWAAFTLIGEAE
ncbi:tetratricopeptide repeat protein [Coleofasciculus sp. E1-EBD-02]|uniref:tetratricopeptide repeat protein n=1 Tax=Coleofasciculus sp. E1-EBD-02 TaxID=3068481 RepID=UPI0032F14E8C